MLAAGSMSGRRRMRKSVDQSEQAREHRYEESNLKRAIPHASVLMRRISAFTAGGSLVRSASS